MLRRTKKHRKKLAKLVLAALLFSGGVHGLMGPSVAEAADPVTVTGYINGTGFVPSGSMIVNSGYAYPADETVTVLNLTPGTGDTWDSGAASISVVGHSGSSASGYTVTMSGDKAQLGMLSGGIYQADGYGSFLGNANENTVSVSSGAAVSDNVSGGYIRIRSNQDTVSKAEGTASNNSVTISGGAAVDDTVYGGNVDADSYAYISYTSSATTAEVNGTAETNQNTVTISDNSSIAGSVYGGRSYNYAYTYVYSYDYTATGVVTSSADRNTVTISGDVSVGNHVYGGYAYAVNYAYSYGTITNTVSGSASNNTVTISDNVVVNYDVYGGSAYAYAYYGIATADATADKNTVTISDSATVKGNVIGGYAYASSYTYAYDGTGSIYPANGSASASENTVTINGAAVSGTVVGGSAYAYVYAYYDGEVTFEETADNNTVTISGDATVDNNISGGKASYGNAANNKVAIGDNAAISGKNATYGYLYIHGGESKYGSADSNTVTISDEALVGENNTTTVYVYGGKSEQYGGADNNTVTISENAVLGSNSADYISVYIYGGHGGSYSGNANQNTVTISKNAVAGTSSGDVYGGYSSSGSANENTVAISNNVVVGRDSADIFGGYGYVEANENTVTISDAAVGSEGYATIRGGHASAYGAEEGGANRNTVTISGEAVLGHGSIYGGETSYVSADDNTVTISGSAAVGGVSNESIYGGYSDYGSAGNNTVTISEKAMVSSQSYVYIYGGNSSYGSADGNTVTVSDSAAVESINASGSTTNDLYVYGGRSAVGSTGNNKITISDSATVGSTAKKLDIYGGYSNAGSADKNEIEISGDTVTVGSVADRLNIFGGFSGSSAATTNENKITISGNAAVGANASNVSVYGGGGVIIDTSGYFTTYTYSAAAANENTVTISENAVVAGNGSASVYGGNSDSNSADSNTVTISGNAVVAGNGSASVYGGYSNSNSADSNTVTISDNTVVGADNGYNGYTYIFGGYGSGGVNSNTVTISNNAVVGGYAEVLGGYSNSADSSANENTVTISDNAIVGTVYAYIEGADSYGSANENTVTISGGAKVAAGSSGYYESVSITGGRGQAAGVVDGSASDNAVTISGDAVVGPDANTMEIRGGYSGKGIASNNTVTISENAVVASGSNAYRMEIKGGHSDIAIAQENTVTISGGTVGNADNYKAQRIVGGSSYKEASGNTVVIESDATVYAGAVFGGYADYNYYSTGIDVTSNTVTISAEGAEVGLVYGGRTPAGNAGENIVTISAGSVTGNVESTGYYAIPAGIASVAGGYSVKDGDAKSNTVEIKGVTVSIPENSSEESINKITLAVVGGYAGTGDAINNTVKLHDVTVTKGGVYGGATDTGGSETGTDTSGSGESVSGSGDVVTGNTLVISGANTVNGEVTNFETIKLAEAVTWADGATVLQANQFVVNADDTRASLDITDAETNLATATSGQMTLLASETADDFKALSLLYSGGTENLSETNQSKILKSGAETTEATPVNGVTLTYASSHLVSLDADNSYKNVLYKIDSIPSKIALSEMTWGTGRDLAGAFNFGSGAVVDATNLTFTGNATIALKKGDSMALVSNATGITTAITPAAGTGKTVGIDYTDTAGIQFDAMATGHVATASNAVNYVVDSVALNGVDIGGWKGSASVVTNGWTKGSSVSVNTGTAALDYAEEKTILTSDQAGMFTGATFSGVNDYNDATNNKHAFTSDTDKGVTLDGTQQKGIKASDDGKNLVYAVNDTKDVETITLGTVKTNDPRDMSGTNFDFANTTKVDASALKLDVVEPLSMTSPVIPLVTNAANLKAGVDVDYGGSKTSHSQDAALVHDDTGIVLNATINGTVATTSETVNYTVTGGALNSIALDNWNGTAVSGSLPASITGSGVTVSTGSFTEPTLAAGQSIDIITTPTDNFFGTVTGDKAFKENAFADDKANGVTLSGNKSGGVKTNDTKTTLTYYAESMSVDQVAFGEMTWNTGRAAAAGYDFTNVTSVDASNLTFTNPEAATGSMDLLTNATNLASDATVDYGTGKSAHSQDFDKTLDNKAVISATLTGTVDTATAGKVSYTATGTSMSKFDLANWDGSSASAVPTGWTANASGITVDTGTTEFSVSAETNVLTAGDAVFSGATFSGSNQYEAHAFASDTQKGVTLDGTQQKGIKASDDGKNLIYAVNDTKDVETITLGAVKTNDPRDMSGTGFDFTNTTTVDATNLKFTDAENVTGSMDLLTNAANLTTVTTVNGASHSQDFDKTLDNKAVISATLTGTVSAAEGKVSYTGAGTSISKINLAKWNGSSASAVPTGWTANASGVAVDTAGMTAPDVAPGNHIDIVQSNTDNFFANATISGGNEYKEGKFNETDGGIQFAGAQSKGVTLNEEKNHIIYAVGTKDVATATVRGEIAWKDGGTYYENTKYNFTDASVTDISGVKFTADTDPLNHSLTLIKNAAGNVADGSPEFTVALNNTTLQATAEGSAAISGGNLDYTVTGVTLDKVTVNSTGSDAVPEGWSVSSDLTVDADSMEIPSGVKAGEEKIILKANSANQFTDDTISDSSNKYGKNADREFTKTDEVQSAVTITGTQDKGVKANSAGDLVYAVGRKEVAEVNVGAVKWAEGTELLDGSSEEYDYTNAAVNNKLTVTYDAPENVAANQSMTLLKANKTLADMAAQEKKHEYKTNPVSGVTVDAMITGNLAAKDGAVTFTAAENKASLLTFEKVEWTGDTALIDHSKTLKNVSFDGATVDTSKIDFYKEIYIEADQTTTLVSDFGGTPKEMKGDTYMVGTAFEGEGSASMENGNLVFRTRTEAGLSEQTHKAVMGVEATMGLLAAGNEHAGKVLDGLGNLSNVGSDGVSTAASIGGGKDRYETGSHVNINSWNAAVGVGARKETEKGTLQYGIFGEYGKGNYKLHSDVGRSDGDAHYAGGGLMAKWMNKHDVYTEASFRLGRVSDSANALLRDGAGNAYGYDIHATYYGAHVGLGKVFHYKGGRSLDVYGKFFYTKRDGAEFDAKQHYNLDSVASSVLRIGARYGTNDKKWNWYGGLAYEYEFDGESTGTVNGTAIRAASIKGGSVRGEFGMRMDATKENPWQTDISIYGSGGKHRGIGGNVSVAYTF